MLFYPLISLLLLVLSFFIEGDDKGLYIRSYLAEGDLYRIGFLQGTAADDYIFIILASMLLSLGSIIILLLPTKPVHKFISNIILFLASVSLLNLMETHDFISILYSTLVYGDNAVFNIWLCGYLIFLFKSIYDLLWANKHIQQKI